jgi:hypothetical protein
MAIDTLAKQAKASAVGVINRKFRKVAGNIAGLIDSGRGQSSADSDPINRTKFHTNTYSFPIDIGDDPGLGNHGHYIMFFINQQDNAKLNFSDPAKENIDKGIENVLSEVQSRGIEGVQKIFDSNVGSYVKKVAPNLSSSQLIDGLTDSIGQIKTTTTGKQKSINTQTPSVAETPEANLFVERPPTVRLDTAITMYMPTTVSVTYGANYTDTEIGTVAAKGKEVVEAFTSASRDVVTQKKVIPETLKLVGEDLELAGIATAGAAVPGAQGLREAIEIQEGVITADRMELAFKGVGKRKFQYSFKMIPRNREEADEIQKIIYAFKFNMLPEFQSGSKSRKMVVPNTFDIQYMYKGAENSYLNKVSTCVLENMTVSQGGDRYKTFSENENGAPPVETTITLDFQELEIITRERVEEGF